jgi:hypothetical protein
MGHLIGKAVGGEGDKMINGQCVNMIPQTASVNRQMGQLAERQAVRATSSPTPVFYLSAAVYDGANYMPRGVWVFIIPSPTDEPRPMNPFLNEQHHIGATGGTA